MTIKDNFQSQITKKFNELISPLSISGKSIYFIGIGGIGMSALAMLLKNVGFEIKGSDSSQSYVTDGLKKAGVHLNFGHSAQNIDSTIGLLVISSAIKDDNEELVRARSIGIKVIKRFDLLRIIMSCKYGITIAGTHGKTTTTGMTSVVLEEAGFDPTVLNGGMINYFGGNSKVGDSKYLVAESDESDGGFVELPTSIGVITNIEPEHLDFYKQSFDLQKKYFERYVNQIPDDGMIALCVDDLEVGKLYEKIRNSKKNIVTFGLGLRKNEYNYDILAKNVKVNQGGTSFNVVIDGDEENKLKVKMPIYGVHNASNSLAAIAIAKFLGVENNKIVKSLSKFDGVKRRFTKVGELDGVVVIDDYAHHPTEIKAVLKSARAFCGDKKIMCVFQPHRFTRVRDLFDEFSESFFDSDIVVVSEIYAASESPLEGITQDEIVKRISEKVGKEKSVKKLAGESDIKKLIKDNLSSGDMIIFCGAGSITKWAHNLVH